MSTHHGFIKEFPFIRVDAFNGDPANLNPFTRKAPHFYLLTHAHTDHIAGLNSPHFHGQIYATPITKQLVLDTVEAADRVRYDELGHRVGRRFKFANLRKVKPRRTSTVAGSAARASRQGMGMDRIKEIPLNTRFEVEGPDGFTVTITALDANHCPGSCMFLLEGTVAGAHRAVLITGDVRIEPWWLDALRHNPLVEPYLPGPRPRTAQAHVEGASSGGRAGEHRGRTRALDCVYLDTSNVLLDEELVTKDQAVAAAVDVMAQYPPETRFFLNTWTWGYEELLKGVHKAFGGEIHLDWYKHRMYTSAPFRVADPLLAQLGTTASFSSPSSSASSPPDARPAVDPSPSLHLRSVAADTSASTSTSTSAWPSAASSASASTSTAPSAAAASSSTAARAPSRPRPLRFHACERRWKCDHVWQDGLGSYSFEPAHLPLLGGPKRLKQPGSGERLSEDEAEGKGENGRGAAPHVVYVNPSEMPRWRWDAYRDEVQGRINEWRERRALESTSGRMSGASGRDDGSGKGKKRSRAEGGAEVELPGALIVPLARHSSLPELQSLVALFRPRTLYPLTCTDDDPVSPAHQYLSLPSLFGALLAPGGETQLRDEAEQYRRHILARQRASGGRTSRIVESSEETPPQDDGGDLIEPAWVTEMSRKGLNIEGGEDVLDEVVGWAQRLAKGERAPSASASPRRSKRARTSRQEDEAPSVDVLELHDSSCDDDDNMVVKIVPRAPVGGRRLSYGSSSPSRRQRTDPAALDLGPSSSTPPYPPGDMPSPFLAAELERRRRAPARDVTPKNALVPSRTASIALRLATTAAKAPPPRKSVTFSSPSRGGHGGVSARTASSAAPDAAAMLPPARRPALLPSFDPSSTASTRAAPQPRTSTSASSSAVHAPLAADPAAPRPGARTSSSSSSAKSTSSTARARPPLATRDKRKAVVACLHRQLRGLIAPQGGRVEPFQPGDPRLQGRRALRAESGGAAEQGSAQSVELEVGKENVRGLEQGEGPSNERSWDSPTSFRTVSVTASP